MIDEPGDVATDRRVAAPVPVDPEHPDAALLEVARLTRLTLFVVAQELAGVIDDPGIFRNRLSGEDAVAVNGRASSNDVWQAASGAHPTIVQHSPRELRGTGCKRKSQGPFDTSAERVGDQL
jgi:hypothetical protein